jgi:hypothetical protein
MSEQEKKEGEQLHDEVYETPKMKKEGELKDITAGGRELVEAIQAWAFWL